MLILFTLLFLMPVFKYLPRVVMNRYFRVMSLFACNNNIISILVVAGIWLLDFGDILFLWKLRAWKDLGLLVCSNSHVSLALIFILD